MLHGRNPLTSVLLEWLDIDQPDGKYDSGRFRDIYLNEDGTKIILYTRNGGGNRDEYQSLIDHLATHPNYLSDYDDDFDCTYAYIEFYIPKEFEKIAKAMATGEKPKTVHEKFVETMNEMKDLTPEQLRADPRFKSTVEILDKIAGSISDGNNKTS